MSETFISPPGPVRRQGTGLNAGPARADSREEIHSLPINPGDLLTREVKHRADGNLNHADPRFNPGQFTTAEGLVCIAEVCASHSLAANGPKR